jgi:hypothetical protein
MSLALKSGTRASLQHRVDTFTKDERPPADFYGGQISFFDEFVHGRATDPEKFTEIVNSVGKAVPFDRLWRRCRRGLLASYLRISHPSAGHAN